MNRSAVVFAALVLSCATTEVAIYPAPFTTEQIRLASPPGRTYEYLDEEPGKPNVHRVMTFEAVTPETAQFRVEMFDDKGVRLGPPRVATAKWTDLHHHGEFPRDEVKTEETSVTVPAGSYVCTRYSVTEKKDGVESVTHYDFARDLPGPPVRRFVESQGKTISSSTLIRYLPGK